MSSPTKQQLPPRASSHNSSRMGSIVPSNATALMSSAAPRISNLRTTSSLSQGNGSTSAAPTGGLLSSSTNNNNMFVKRTLTPTFNNNVTTVLYNADLEASSGELPPMSTSLNSHPQVGGGAAAPATTTVGGQQLSTTKSQLFANSSTSGLTVSTNINNVMPIVPSSAPHHISGSPFKGIGGLFSGRGSPTLSSHPRGTPSRLAALSTSPLSPSNVMFETHSSTHETDNVASVIQGLMSTTSRAATVDTASTSRRLRGIVSEGQTNNGKDSNHEKSPSLTARAEEMATALGRDLLLLQRFMDVKVSTMAARATTPSTASKKEPIRSISPNTALRQQNSLELRHLEQALIDLRQQGGGGQSPNNGANRGGSADVSQLLNRIVSITELFQAKSQQLLSMMTAATRRNLFVMPSDSPMASPFMALAQAALTPADEAASPANFFTLASSSKASINTASSSGENLLAVPDLNGNVSTFLPSHQSNQPQQTHWTDSFPLKSTGQGGELSGSGKHSPKLGGTTNTATTDDEDTDSTYSPHSTAHTQHGGVTTPPNMGSKRGSVLSNTGKENTTASQLPSSHSLGGKQTSFMANIKGALKTTPTGSKQGTRTTITSPSDANPNHSPNSSSYGQIRQKRLSAATQKFLLENGFITMSSTLPPQNQQSIEVTQGGPQQQQQQPSSQKGSRNRTSSVGAGGGGGGGSVVSTPAIGSRNTQNSNHQLSPQPQPAVTPAAPAIDSFGNFGILIDDLGDVNGLFERLVESIQSLREQKQRMEKRSQMEKAKYAQKEGQLALEHESMEERLQTAELEAAESREALAEAKQILASLAAKEAGRSMSPNVSNTVHLNPSPNNRNPSTKVVNGKREGSNTPTPAVSPSRLSPESPLSNNNSRMVGGIKRQTAESPKGSDATPHLLLESDSYGSLLPTIPTSSGAPATTAPSPSTPPPAPLGSSRIGTAGGGIGGSPQNLNGNQSEYGRLNDNDHRTYQRHIKLLEQRLAVSEGQLAQWKADVHVDTTKMSNTQKRVADLESEVAKLNRRLSTEHNEHEIAKKQIVDITHMRNEEAKMCSVAVRHLEERLAESKDENDKLQMRLNLLSNNFRRLFCDWMDNDLRGDSLTKELEAAVKELSIYRSLYNPAIVINLEALQERYLQTLHQLDESQGTVAALRQDIDHVNLQRKLALNDTKEFVERIKGCAEWKLMLARLPEEAGQLDQRMLHLCAERDRRIVDISVQLQNKSAEFIAKVKAETNERRLFRDNEYRESNTYWQEHDCPEMRRVTADAFAASFYHECPTASTDLSEVATFTKAQADSVIAFKNVKHPSVPGSSTSTLPSPKPAGSSSQYHINTYRPQRQVGLDGTANNGMRGTGVNLRKSGVGALSTSKSSANLEIVADAEVIDAFILAAMSKDITFKEFVKEQAAAKAMA